MMKVLVTGASSPEGKTVISELLTTGHTVVGISRTPSGVHHDRYTWHCMDLSDVRYVYALANLCKPDPIRAVIHCAPARYLPVIREALAGQTGLILSGGDCRQWVPLLSGMGVSHVAVS